MKKQIFALFPDTDFADKAINDLHNELGIDSEEISFLYQNKDGERIEGEGDDIASETVGEGAADGAVTGGVIGAVVGLAAVAGLAGPLGPVLAAGPIAAALGVGGAVGTTATGAAAGAAIGGLVGALTNMGLGEPKAREFEERVGAGEVLVAVHAEDVEAVTNKFDEHSATHIEVVEAVLD